MVRRFVCHRTVAGLFLLLCAAPLAGAAQDRSWFTDSRPVWSPNGGTIVFDRNRVNLRPGHVIAAVSPDGTDQRRLIPTQAHHPSWSPDGTRLAYLDNRRNGRAELYVMNADGTGRRQLTGNLRRSSMSSWSPDGRKIALEAFGVVYVVNADGGGFRRLTPANATDWAFAWSPNGSAIATTGTCGVCITDVARGTRRRLTRMGALHDVLSWSPDGHRLVFASDQHAARTADGGSAGELYVINADGSGLRRLSHYGDDVAYDTDPLWSPDGRTIAYKHGSAYELPSGNGLPSRGGYTRWDVYAMDADGSNQRPLTQDGRSGDAAWSPDSRMLAFVSRREGSARVYVMHLEGGPARRIS
jgi:Tol biopolymer transport system component